MQRLPQQHQDNFHIPVALRAPLATFDTIDLGDEDVQLVKTSPAKASAPVQTSCQLSAASCQEARALQPPTVTTKIGGAQSKGRGPASKSGSDPPGQDPQDHVTQGSPVRQADQDPHQDPELEDGGDDDTPTPTNQSPAHEYEVGLEAATPCAREGLDLEAVGDSSSDPSGKESEDAEAGAKPPPPPPRLGKIKSTWLQHQDSDSSSSSGSGSEGFNFRPIQGSASASATQDDDDDDDTDYTPQTRRRLILREKSYDYSLNLYPDDLDPTNIASPSKRKAYQKRLQRLQVKTSPIVRPRSTTPINVVTLDEYILSSPEPSPASPFPEKLKISLPSSEFAPKPKSPRISRKPSIAQDDSCFKFNEEILFSRTRSALVVDEVGHVPPSPRRVLIPPTLSPSSSPKLGRASGQCADDVAPQLVYFSQQKEDKIFGQPADAHTSDNWATFPDPERTDKAPETLAVKEQRLGFPSDSEREAEVDEYLTVNIDPKQATKPANIEVVLSAASSNTPSPSTPDSDEAIKATASHTVLPQVEEVKVKVKEVIVPSPSPSPRPPPIPPRRRPPPPPPPPRRPPDVVPGDNGSEPMTKKCDLLVDIDSQ